MLQHTLEVPKARLALADFRLSLLCGTIEDHVWSWIRVHTESLVVVGIEAVAPNAEGDCVGEILQG